MLINRHVSKVHRRFLAFLSLDMAILSTLASYVPTSFQDGRLLVGAMILFMISGAFSRLYLHPLARFPGPLLAALTGYYQTYFDIVKGGELIPQLQKLHERYGTCLVALDLSWSSR